MMMIAERLTHKHVKIALAVAGCVALCACEDKLAEAKQRVEIIKRNYGSPRELCAAQRAVVAAYLDNLVKKSDKKGELEYQREKVKTELVCNDPDFQLTHLAATA